MASRPSASINLGLPVMPDVVDPDIQAALLNIHNAVRNVMYAVDAYTGNQLVSKDDYSSAGTYDGLLTQKTAIVFVRLSEAVTQGLMVNIWNSGGPKGRKAGGSNRAHGFALSSGAAGEKIPVCLLGLCSLVGGLTPGASYYLASTGGLITTTATYHYVGFALDTDKLWFSP